MRTDISWVVRHGPPCLTVCLVMMTQGGEQVDKCVGCKSVDRVGWLVGGMMLVCVCVRRDGNSMCAFFSVLRYLAAPRPAAFAQKLILI